MNEFLDPSIILASWKKDCILDEVLIDESALKICVLHSKYLGYQSRLKKQLRSLLSKKKAFPAVERRESKEYANLMELIAQHEDVIENCSEIIKSINQMSFTLNTITKWRSFTAGLNP